MRQNAMFCFIFQFERNLVDCLTLKGKSHTSTAKEVNMWKLSSVSLSFQRKVCQNHKKKSSKTRPGHDSSTDCEPQQ